MRLQTTDETGKNYVYEVNFWSGKKRLVVDGVAAAKVSKTEFRLPDGKHARIKGNFITGVTIIVNGRHMVLNKNSWYEWILIFLPILNIGAGIFFGAIGGGLSVLCGFVAATVNATILRSKLNIFAKILLCLLVIAVSTVWFLVVLLIAGGLAALFA